MSCDVIEWLLGFVCLKPVSLAALANLVVLQFIQSPGHYFSMVMSFGWVATVIFFLSSCFFVKHLFFSLCLVFQILRFCLFAFLEFFSWDWGFASSTEITLALNPAVYLSKITAPMGLLILIACLNWPLGWLLLSGVPLPVWINFLPCLSRLGLFQLAPGQVGCRVCWSWTLLISLI